MQTGDASNLSLLNGPGLLLGRPGPLLILLLLLLRGLSPVLALFSLFGFLLCLRLR
jgi:hypothetical protein